MRIRPFLLLVVLLLPLPSTASSALEPPWLGHEDALETFLREAEPISSERLGAGITRPRKVVLELDGVRHAAVFKPIVRSEFAGGLESYHSEIAAYRLSRYLGIDMVPPTVERRIGRRDGSLQLWAEGYRPFAHAAEATPPFVEWTRQMSHMSLFDTLIDNPDRHAANFLVDDQWDVVLIDHSRALNSDHRGPLRDSSPPVRFDRQLIERLRALDLAKLEQLLGDQLARSDLKTLLHRRDLMLDHVDRLAETRGPRIAFFRD